MMDLISKYSPVVEQYSIDECFVDFTGMNYIYDDYIKLAYTIKDTIYKTFGFTVNIGVANNKLCAKMASDFEKPNKVHTLFSDEVEKKLLPLPVDNLFMVGKKTAKKLHDLGINTIKDLHDKDLNFLIDEFKSQGEYLYNSARGIDNSIVDNTLSKAKSISVSWTLERDTDDINYIKKILLKQVDEVGRLLRKNKQFAKTITITYKNSEFDSFSKQITLNKYICTNDDIYRTVIDLLLKSWDFEKIRNIGVRLSNFNDSNDSNSLFEKEESNDDKLQKTIDDIKNKYGSDVINPALLMEKDK